MSSKNEYTDAAGVRYVAKAADKSNICAGCALLPLLSQECIASIPCGKPARDDEIIWVKAEEWSHA